MTDDVCVSHRCRRLARATAAFSAVMARPDRLTHRTHDPHFAPNRAPTPGGRAAHAADAGGLPACTDTARRTHGGTGWCGRRTAGDAGDKVRSVSAQTVPVLIEVVGQAEGSREVEVRARVSGVLERQLYKEGERVRVGAPLFSIECAPFEIALAQVRAQIAQDQARLAQTRREADRLRPLAAMQAISQREADDAASNVSLAEAALAVTQARVREAELNLSYTAVGAPG